MGPCELRNRIALTATLTNFGRDHRITSKWKDFLVERAAGGAALIISEIIAVDPEALANPAVVTGFDDTNIEGFHATAEAVRSQGSHLLGQLWHPGRQQLWHPTRSPMGVSDQPDAYSWTVPHVMRTDEVRRVVQAFVAAALRLAHCGFAGVELHGAHGYLIGQFLSPWSNQRDDEYGGTLANRARFAIEIAKAIRESLGADFLLGLKMPADERVAGGIDPIQAAALTTHLAEQQLFDYFAYGQGNFSLSLEDHVPDMHYRDGQFIELHRSMRAAAAGTPVMALGKIGSASLAERVVAEGYGDLVGMSRALIADAALPRKAKALQLARIRPCIYNNFCWGEVHQGKPLAEFHNPLLGTNGEASWSPEPSASPKRIVIVGAGVAGMECAWVAAARGHEVTIVSAGQTVGGNARLEAVLPGHGDVAQVYAHQTYLANEYKVQIRLGERANAATITAMRPDVVVLATGSTLRVPSTLEAATGAMQSAREYARQVGQGAATSGGTAVLFDQDHSAPTYAIAEHLAKHYDQLVLLTPRTQIAQQVNYCSALGIYRRLFAAGVDIRIAADPIAWDGKIVVYRNVFSGKNSAIEDVTKFVYATPRRSVDDLQRELRAKDVDIDIHSIGDCVSPRNMLTAIHEGFWLANQL